MNKIYQKALSLYNQGHYEEALDILTKNQLLSTLEGKQLAETCQELVTEQYKFLIKEYITQQDYIQALELKETYLSKYGKNKIISSIPIPHSILKIKNKKNIIKAIKWKYKENEHLIKDRLKLILAISIWALILIIADINNESGSIVLQIWNRVLSTNQDTFLYNNDNATDTTSMISTQKENNEFVNQIESDANKQIIATSSQFIYYLQKEGTGYGNKFYIANKENKSIEEIYMEKPDDFGFESYIYNIKEAFIGENENEILIIGENGGKFGGDLLVKFNTQNKSQSTVCCSQNIKKENNSLRVTNLELIQEGDCIANNQYFPYDEIHDYEGNKIEGNAIAGKGYIGQYPIELSIHSLQGEIIGWYKYQEHTNYMTLKGKIDANNMFEFTEYNEKNVPIATFRGKANFNQQTMEREFNHPDRTLTFNIKGVPQKTNQEYDKLKDLITDWNSIHTHNIISSTSLECLYAENVKFYGQHLSSKKCATLIISTMKKYDSYYQHLKGEINYTPIDEKTVRCDFIKQVEINGNNKDYEAYLILHKEGDWWSIIEESDKTTDKNLKNFKTKRN